MIDYPQYKKVLFCTDFSDNADCAFGYAFGIAKRDDSMLYILHVIEPIPEQYINISSSAMNQEDFDKTKDAIKNGCKDCFEKQYLNKIKDKNKVKYFARVGNQEDEIIKFATEEAVDLIVIGTHGRTGLKHIFLGSVAEKVVRYSPFPVFIIPSKNKACQG
jgi:universal stress protein A